MGILGLAITGLYAKVRHPQHDGFIIILTIIMFPILVYVYVRFARSEERQMLEAFGEEYKRYAKVTPAFIPRVF